MRKHATKRIEKFRLTVGPLASVKEMGANGAFIITHGNVRLAVIASDGTDWDGMPGEPWEHVSVSVVDRCPTWDEMDYIKRTFWNDDETVMQLHVPRETHINQHEFCLHLWRPLGESIPLPPPVTV